MTNETSHNSIPRRHIPLRHFRKHLAGGIQIAGSDKAVKKHVPRNQRPLRHSIKHLPRVTQAAEPRVDTGEGGGGVDAGDGTREAGLEEEGVNLLGFGRRRQQPRAGREGGQQGGVGAEGVPSDVVHAEGAESGVSRGRRGAASDGCSAFERR
uniref:Uncharacterized protein n=1 Tax=Triticum urartu TaxID=4572 RepID=A0A8R7QVV5_TRIUA